MRQTSPSPPALTAASPASERRRTFMLPSLAGWPAAKTTPCGVLHRAVVARAEVPPARSAPRTTSVKNRRSATIALCDYLYHVLLLRLVGKHDRDRHPSGAASLTPGAICVARRAPPAAIPALHANVPAKPGHFPPPWPTSRLRQFQGAKKKQAIKIHLFLFLDYYRIYSSSLDKLSQLVIKLGARI